MYLAPISPALSCDKSNTYKLKKIRPSYKLNGNIAINCLITALPFELARWCRTLKDNSNNFYGVEIVEHEHDKKYKAQI